MRIKSESGISLVELMVAVFLFAVAISALLSVMTQGVTVAKRADYAYVAQNLAKNHMERLRSIGFSSVTSDADETATRLDRDGDPDPDGDYERTTTVTTNYGANSNLTQVTIQVNYYFRGVLSPAAKKVTAVLYNE